MNKYCVIINSQRTLIEAKTFGAVAEKAVRLARKLGATSYAIWSVRGNVKLFKNKLLCVGKLA